MMEINGPQNFDARQVPTSPGVYLFRDEGQIILYCGKAKNLRNRVGSYFSNQDRLAIKTRHLVTRIRSVDWIVVRNEVEALLLENKLIKQHSPRYNIMLKDAKTFAYIAFTKDKFPRILTSRKTGQRLESFGPYTDGMMRRELQKLVVGIFKIRTCTTLPNRACLNYHIGICTAPCIRNVTAEEYQRQVEAARHFLKGNIRETVDRLKKQMKEASEEKRYERALECRNQLSSIELLSRRQIVDNERDYDQDVIAFKKVGEKMTVVQMGVRKGVLLGKKDFKVEMQENFEQEFLRAFYSANQIPREIIIRKGFWTDDSERRSLEAYFETQRGGRVSLVVPEKGEKVELLNLAEENIAANMEYDSALIDLKEALNLPSLPLIIESFDISNTGDEHIVSGMVRFVNGKPDRSGYRKFRMRTVNEQNDFASMREVVLRRYKRLLEEKAQMPDLILIDGGAEQLGAAIGSLKSLGLSLPIIGLAKKFEEIYLPDEMFPRKFDKNSKMMLLLRRVRDATHDFSLGYNKKRRQMKMREEFLGK
ncbi:MAG: excinuclease ABC subunit UvrC [Candidatus Micrarchaeota archaeon]|nr:excinuclease ABC subunit UvrC [Candidatus Micrarchaeota archaeon]MDE1847991.1 excinuclease ABC subunit UvrC [Candidatus Micrarchaeota archaeon]MDE1864695.1 excinuclease ABC subunit UvrC [Candidatus Micrarchaeota archaeon]